MKYKINKQKEIKLHTEPPYELERYKVLYDIDQSICLSITTSKQHTTAEKV